MSRVECILSIFFFQAEDGIRDIGVTGVQTCALPICIITPEKWGNLPGGEIFTAPANTDGTFVVDGVVGDYLCSKYGDLRDAPLTINVADNRIVDLRSENKELLDDFRAYTSTDENSNRVGEFAIGTNTD